MDLSTILRRLRSRSHYSRVTQYLADVTLMCTNAMVYNPPDSIYYQRARKVPTFLPLTPCFVCVYVFILSIIYFCDLVFGSTEIPAFIAVLISFTCTKWLFYSCYQFMTRYLVCVGVLGRG